MATVLKHEAFCFDSFKTRLFWLDDFEGDQIKDEWNSQGSAGYTTGVVDGVDGGIVRLTTHIDNTDYVSINWGSIRSLLVTKNVSFEARVKAGATIGKYYIGMWYAWDTMIMWLMSTGYGNSRWRNKVVTAGVGTDVDTGILIDTNWHLLRIECHTDGGNHVHFYLDNVLVSTTVTASIPTAYMFPVVQVSADAASGATTMDVDYVGVSQDR